MERKHKITRKRRQGRDKSRRNLLHIERKKAIKTNKNGEETQINKKMKTAE